MAMTRKVITSNLSKLSQRHRRNTKRLPGAIEAGFAEIGRETIALYQKTTRTWKHKPRFHPVRTARGITINTDDQIFMWIDEGTKGPYKIPKRPKTDRDPIPFLVFRWPYKAATRPRVIASYAASRGKNLAFKRQVTHPGIKARKFTAEITKRMQKRAAGIMRKRINDAINVEAVGL